MLGQGSLPLHPQAACPASRQGLPWKQCGRRALDVLSQPVAMQQHADAQAGAVCAPHRKMQSVIRGEGTAPMSPAGRLKHHTHAYLIEPSPTERREKRCSKQMVFCSHDSCYTAFWQEPQFILQPCHSPPLSCSSLPSRTTSTKYLSKAYGSPTTSWDDCRAPLSCSIFLLPSVYRHLFWATFKQGQRKKGKDLKPLDGL